MKNKKANPFFKFKQFTIYQDQCAMKVGTDGVLLGAYAHFDNPKNILDIGTGTGLLSLMMAQKFPNAAITAIEIEEKAFKQAKSNFEIADLGKNILSFHTSFQDFTTNQKFDLIVCNPPFFINALKPENQERLFARHTDFLPILFLMEKVKLLLNENGCFYMIFPAENLIEIEKECEANQLFINEKLLIKPTTEKAEKRIIFQIGLHQKPLFSNTLIIESERHQYSEAYKNLTKDFYLNF